MAVSIALNEVYYGKTPNLIKAEKLMAEIKKDWDECYSDGPRVMADRRWRECSDLLANEFGLERLWMSLYSDKMVNMMTPPITLAIECVPVCRVKKNLLIDERGMKFKPSAGYVIHVMCFTGMILNPDFTAGEIIATILHEIGHNFQCVIDDKSYYLQDFTYLTVIAYNIFECLIKQDFYGVVRSAATPLLYSQIYTKVQMYVAEALSKMAWFAVPYVIYDKIMSLFKNIYSNVIYVVNSITSLAAFPTMLYVGILNGLVSSVFNPLGYRHEKIADNFATMYGYSAELSSALLKMDINKADYNDIQKLCNYVPILGWRLRQGHDACFFCISLLDCHPKTMERCLDQVRYLKTELNRDKSIAKGTKDSIKRQIDQIESNISFIMADPKLDEHWGIFSYTVAQTIMTQGGDIRRSFDPDIHASIQKTYDKAVKSMR